MNWGGFAGGFSQGFNSGVNIGKTLGDAIKQKRLEDIRAKGIEEAKGMHESAVAGLVKESGLPEQAAPAGQQAAQQPVQPQVEPSGAQITPVAPQPKVEAAPVAPAGTPKYDTEGEAEGRAFMAAQKTAAAPAITPQAEIAAKTGVTPAKRFMVGEQGFDTREQAMEAARKKAPSVMDFMSKTLVPKMQEAYVAQGDMEKAEAWGQWAEQRQNKKAMAEWASAWRAASMGNIEKAADHVFNLYKTYDDGITPLSKEVVKDKAGNITGFNVKLKVEETGEERTQFIDQKSLTEMGLAALSPPQMFEQQFKRQQAADQAAATQRAELAKEGRADNREIAKENRARAWELAKEGRTDAREASKAARDQNYALEKMTIEKQLDEAGATSKTKREVNAKVEFLRGAGYSEEFINEALPTIIGIGDYKKKTSPEEARRLAYSDRMKSDPTFARKAPDEQQRILDQDMKLITGGVDPKAAPNPAASGLPAKPQQSRGVPVYDTKTGAIVYR